MSYLKALETFKITPTSTTISNIKTKEKVDIMMLNKLLSSDLLKDTFSNKYQQIYKNELNQLIEYKKMINSDGYIYINMKKNKPYGRSHASLSLLQIRRQIRQSITKDIYVDVDIENCHVVILQQICKKNKVKTPKMDDYVNNREQHLKQIMDEFDVPRDDAKRVFLVAIYCGNFILEGKEPQFYTDLISETRSIAKIITNQNPEIKEMVEQEEKVTNVNGKVLSHYLQEFEHLILDEVFKYCVSKKCIVDNDCSLQADGIMIRKENYKESVLNELTKHIKKTIGFNLKFTQKQMTQHYCDIVNDHQLDFKVPKLDRNMPELTFSPNVEGSEKYLSNIFTQKMYDDNDTIILQSCCGTGKTYSVAKYSKDNKSVILSIVNRKSLLKAQIKEFSANNITLNNYENKDEYDVNMNGIICINSIMKYSRLPESHFKNFIVYIDEVNSLIETLTHCQILTKDIKLVYQTLIKIIKNSKKVIVSDHTINNNVLDLLSTRLTKKEPAPFYVKNLYQKFEGVKAEQIKVESVFKDKIEATMKNNEGFFAGFDSARCASQYFHNLKDKTELECILVTDETKVTIPNDLSVWEGKCIFYSPKIETGVDFSVDTKQSVFYHMKGDSILPTSSFQMVTRTRNMKDLTYYCQEKKEKQYKYKSLVDVQSNVKQEQEITNLYMNCFYLDSDDRLVVSENSFFRIYCFNEYIKDMFESNKIEHFKYLLYSNGFKCVEDLSEVFQTIPRDEKKEMKEVAQEGTEEIFNEWLEGNIINENYDIRKSILKLDTKKEVLEYKEYIFDKSKFENHSKTVLLMKEDSYIQDKSKEMMTNSFKEFGIHNIFSKIELLSKYEKECKITRFQYDKATPTVKDSTWSMIKKLFRKTTKKPENKDEVIKEYVAMVNNIAKIYKSKRTQDNFKKSTVYDLSTKILSESYILDEKANVDREDYSEQVLDFLKFKKPIKKEYVCKEEKTNKSELDFGLP